MLFFVGKSHRVENKVKGSLTFIAPRMRHMATSSNIPPITTNTAPTATNPETDTHHKSRLAFGDMQKNPNIKLMNNI